MKLPPFTLVHDPRVRRDPEQLEGLVEASLRGIAPELVSSLRSVNPALGSALLRSFGASKPLDDSESLLRAVINELERAPQVDKVGLWDLSSQVGELPAVLVRLNEVQPVIAFFETQASVPVGLVSRPERVIRKVLESGATLSHEEQEAVGNNILFGDFAMRADRVREDLGIDYLIGITSSMVAFEDSEGIHWNYFSCSSGRVVLASTYDVYEYALEAQRPFEAAVAGIAVSQLLVAMNPDLDYHPEIRGCFFDFNEDRDTIVKALKVGEIEPGCLELIQPRYRDAALALTAALRDYRKT